MSGAVFTCVELHGKLWLNADEVHAEILRLTEMVGSHDPTGADHMDEMMEHATRADLAEAKLERIAKVLA